MILPITTTLPALKRNHAYAFTFRSSRRSRSCAVRQSSFTYFEYPNRVRSPAESRPCRTLPARYSARRVRTDRRRSSRYMRRPPLTPMRMSGAMTTTTAGMIHHPIRASTTAIPITRTMRPAAPITSSNACLTGPRSGIGSASPRGPISSRRIRSIVSGSSTYRYAKRARFSVKSTRNPRRRPASIRASVSVRALVSSSSTVNNETRTATGTAIASQGSRPAAVSRAVAMKRSIARTMSGPLATPAASASTARISAAIGASSNTMATPLNSV